MNIYKFTKTGVFKNSITAIEENGYGWKEYLQWVSDGGITEPYKTFEEWKEQYKNDAKINCSNNIYSFYPVPVQQSMALGIYPSEMSDVMVLFIADCIETENTLNEQYELATTEAELEAVVINWPIPSGV